MIDFWFDRGVAGFRVDAVPYLFEDADLRDEPKSDDPNAENYEWNSLKHIYTSDLPGTYDMIYQWRKHVDDYSNSHGGDARYIKKRFFTNMFYV